MPPPTIAITMSEEISFAFAGNRSIARAMHIPKLFAVRSATKATIARNANGVDTNGIAAVATRPSPMNHEKHFAADMRAKTMAPANAAAVLATK